MSVALAGEVRTDFDHGYDFKDFPPGSVKQ